MTNKKDPTNAARQQTYRDKSKAIKEQWAVILEAIKKLDELKRS